MEPEHVEQTIPVSSEIVTTHIDPSVDAPDFKPRKEEDKPKRKNLVTPQMCTTSAARALFPAPRNLRADLRAADSQYFIHDPRLPTEEWDGDDDIGFTTHPMDPADAKFISTTSFVYQLLERLNDEDARHPRRKFTTGGDPGMKTSPGVSPEVEDVLTEDEEGSQASGQFGDEESAGTQLEDEEDDVSQADEVEVDVGVGVDDIDVMTAEEEEEEDDDDDDDDEEEGGEAEEEPEPTIVPNLPPRPVRRNELGHLDLRVIYEKDRTGFEESRDFQIVTGDRIAGRYEVVEYIGSAAFSRAVQCFDHITKQHVCIKIVKNDKDYFDQSLDEIKVLQLIREHDPDDEMSCVRVLDYFYFKENLFIVCELLRDNLYECQKFMAESDQPNYFTLPRLQQIARQVLTSLAYIHRLNLIHADLKPENILIQSYSKCLVKVIDFGSSCYEWDQLVTYVQSRSYRAPEVILGSAYDSKIDLWSLGAILFELLTGRVLFLNESIQTLLARIMAIVGPIPRHMLLGGSLSHQYFTRELLLFEQTKDQFDVPQTVYLVPKRTSLKERLGVADNLAADFIRSLLQVDPQLRPTALEALEHPWLTQRVY